MLISFPICAQAATEKEALDYVYKHNIVLGHELEKAPDQFVKNELVCLSLNIYHESRGSIRKDKEGVGFVTLNRLSMATRNNNVPKTICDVVFQHATDSNGVKLRTAQFSWTTKTREDIFPKEHDSWIESQKIAAILYEGKAADHTNGATHFFNSKLTPSWSQNGLNKKQIGEHTYVRLAKY